MNDKFNISIDFNACKECGYCKLVCKKNVFGKEIEFNEKGYKPYKVISADKCIGCKKCFFACPDFAIKIDRVEE
jgi:2-oxoglutarate ferredoxin oxidoreductase subunit delta